MHLSPSVFNGWFGFSCVVLAVLEACLPLFFQFCNDLRYFERMVCCCLHYTDHILTCVSVLQSSFFTTSSISVIMIEFLRIIGAFYIFFITYVVSQFNRNLVFILQEDLGNFWDFESFEVGYCKKYAISSFLYNILALKN